MTLEHFGLIADIAGVLGLLLTLVLLIRSESLHKFISHKYAYEENRTEYKKSLQAIRDTIIKDGVVNERLVSELRIILNESNEKHGRLNKRRDKRHIKMTFRLLDEEP